MNVQLILMLIAAFLLGAFIQKRYGNEEKKTMEKFEANSNTCKYLYWKDCGHCKTFNPEWAKFESSYKGQLKLAKLEKDESDEHGTCMEQMKKYEAQGFPSVFIIDGDGNKIAEHNGERTKEGLTEFCNQHS